MMSDLLLQLGAGGLLAFLIIREVLNFLINRNKNDKQPDLYAVSHIHDHLDRMEGQVGDLWTWHNQNDADGVKVWYVRRSLEETVDKLADAIHDHNIVLRELALSNKELARLIHRGEHD